jgi:hypothetical protein
MASTACDADGLLAGTRKRVLQVIPTCGAPMGGTPIHKTVKLSRIRRHMSGLARCQDTRDATCPRMLSRCISSRRNMPRLKERKKERFCTGLSANAMGPRAVAGGVYALGNHPESCASCAQQRYRHHNTNQREQVPNARRHRHGETIAHTQGTAAYQQPAGGSGTQHICAHWIRAQQQRHP